jgi:acyl dehydratase
MWFEDVVIGERRELGSYTFTQEEIIAFARAWDPQPFHIDVEAANSSMFGGIIASGWHTGAVWMKLMVADRVRHPDRDGAGMSGVSPGFEDLRWLKPVRPGMTLSYSTEYTEKIELRSRPEIGLVKMRNEARDGNGECVMRFMGKAFFARKPAA